MSQSGEDAVDSKMPGGIEAHAGVWEGTFTHRDADTGEVRDRHRSWVEVGVRGDKYAQRNRYEWDDGRKETLVFYGAVRNGRVEIAGSGVRGYAVCLDEGAVVFYGQKEAQALSFVDVITKTGEDARARTWQVFDGKRVCTIVHVVERRVCTRDVYDEIAQ
ncbi:hypothetical protein BWQ96_05604 [Gracilariopsis chorda]|uniref:DUF3598 domain-containing protein n=1 Tax=Gracilariopsis chorda TaxID=448386 RepID=A0A2V3IRB4_9FLOR|nr:hypothetical protein BWQ96_05604 [Gracilariopsis chorda]|eukprot:PXF44662.1 hypothetical protein BWQ96_05604 [Gracilariopsis chorda]